MATLAVPEAAAAAGRAETLGTAHVAAAVLAAEQPAGAVNEPDWAAVGLVSEVAA